MQETVLRKIVGTGRIPAQAPQEKPDSRLMPAHQLAERVGVLMRLRPGNEVMIDVIGQGCRSDAQRSSLDLSKRQSAR